MGLTILAELRRFVVYIHRFFFFQAEDGIRDYKVTGVQTCALPISGRRQCRSSPPSSLPAPTASPACTGTRTAGDWSPSHDPPSLASDGRDPATHYES